MSRRAFSLGFVLAACWLGANVAAAPARAAEEDVRKSQQFFQGLRDRGYYDLAAEYLETLRGRTDLAPDFQNTIDYELGRLLLDEASKTGDLVRRREMLDQARAKLDAFTKGSPNHAKAPDALLELARLLVERGHLAMLQADEAEAKADKATKTAEARASFDQARTAYTTAGERLKADFAKYPPYVPDNDPRKDQKERVHNSLMQAQLQRALVDYEEGQTFELGSKERTELMSKALTQFEDIYKRYRTQFAGLTAQMWQAKCYEERGEIGPALGIYNILLEHSDPRLRVLQRYVAYFKIIALGKRKEYALAADESVRWLQTYNTPDAIRSKEGLGVQMELVKNIIAQMPGLQSEKEKDAATKRIVDVLGNVVRYTSPFKAEAIALLKQYKPSAAVNVMDVAKLNYDDALAQGEQALASHDLDRAASLLKQAIKRAEAVKDIDKMNYARYNLAFCYYTNKQFYEAAVLGDHLARRYPRGGLSAKAAELGMASLADAYNVYAQVDHEADLNNLIELCKYTAETYSEQEQGDTAKLTLGQIYHGTGRYKQAVEVLGTVRPNSPKWLDSLSKLGAAHWSQSRSLRDANKTAEADTEQEKAIASLQSGLKAHQDAGHTSGDPGLIGIACDLASIFLEIGKADEALKLIEPLAKAQTTKSGPVYTKLMTSLLRAHIGTNQVELAMADMAQIEQAGTTGAGLTQLYYSLGKLLEKEMDTRAKKGDRAGVNRIQTSYQKFLAALVSSKSGQTYDSLDWAGSSMLSLGNAKEAEPVFRQILKTYENDPKFLGAQGSDVRLLRTRLRLAASLRGQKNFGEAESLISQLINDNPKAIEPLIEKGLLLEDQAQAKAGKWPAAFTYWQNLAIRLERGRVKPLQYYEAWYHAAYCLSKDGKTKEAKQRLASVMRLSSSVGGPEMKQKYKVMLDQLK